jgi:alanyl-tRNA synthetase
MTQVIATTLAEIRTAFLKFFAEHGHQVVPSSSLVPGDDPTLLFTNAGMVQFKDVFLGKSSRSYQRAVSSQRVVRAGGKHNDLDNVGYTARHHTFFEMLGNFSFGDYFKAEAIRFAWQFLTQVLAIPTEKLSVTVFHQDQQAYDIWRQQIGVPAERIYRLDEKDNFWAMGDTGPCGPCTEIFYDHGPSVAGGPPGSAEADGDRFIEVWNIVFMQYERFADGRLIDLPKPSVDTGMGLERIAAVMQGVHNNYQIDVFQALIVAIAGILNVADLEQQSLRVIADHIRSCSFLLMDGVMPSNEGRGYVLRRIIRRAVRHGRQLGATEPFFHRCVPVLVAQMGDAYPELHERAKQIKSVLLREEQRFLETLDQGLKLLEKTLLPLKPGQALAGEVAFTLYDTYGFPLDLTLDLLREKNIALDQAGFDQAMAAQRLRSQEQGQFSSENYARLEISRATEFLGYAHHQVDAQVLLVNDTQVVLNQTPFYAESGGQIGDCGCLRNTQGQTVFAVEDTIKNGDVVIHQGKLLGPLAVNDTVLASIDTSKRLSIQANHSATHLLHAALRALLGSHVQQKGSLVTAERLRFDFSHDLPIHAEQLHAIENLVNQQIRLNTAVGTQLMSLEQAKAAGAMALFGEKYQEQVRVLTMGHDAFSVELCGGTHVGRTGDIGLFKILQETGIASGVRRIEAATGQQAVELTQQHSQLLDQLVQQFKVKPDQLLDKSQQVLLQIKTLEKQLAAAQQSALNQQRDQWLEQVNDVNGIKLLAIRVPGAVDVKQLRILLDQSLQKLGTAIVLLAAEQDGKINLVAAVADALIPQYHAGELVSYVAQQLGGKGGGKAQMAMGGVQLTAGQLSLNEALASVTDWVKQRLS